MPARVNAGRKPIKDHSHGYSDRFRQRQVPADLWLFAVAGAESMHRIESLFLVFCGLVLLILIMRPSAETLFGHIFPWWLKAFPTSFLQALFISLMLFGILGIFRGAECI